MAKSRFRIRIDGTWTAKEMADLFQSCDTIYGHLAQLHSRELQRELTRQTNEPSPVGNSDGRDLLLKVTRVSYGSPGWADFFGAGELVGHLKDFVLEIIKLVVERRDREQTRRLRDAQVEAAIL